MSRVRLPIRTAVKAAAVAATLAAFVPATHAQDAILDHGSDIYAANDDTRLERNAPRNAFLSGGSVEIDAPVGRDAHVAGFDIDVRAPVTGDVYGAGIFSSYDAPIGGDLTAVGFRVETDADATVTGNLRAAAQRVTLRGPIEGSALVTADRLLLDAPVTGDLVFAGRDIAFGPQARVAGSLTYHTPLAVEVPLSVASADRVRHEILSPPDYAERFGEGAARGASNAFGFDIPPAWTIALGVLAALVVLVLVGLLFLGLAPRTIEHLRADIENRMWRSFGFGLIGLATLFGLVPLAAMSIVGIPLVPLIVLLTAILTAFAFLLGAYALSHRVFGAFGARQDSMPARLTTFVVGVVVLSLLNVVPILGWLLSGFAILIGFGALEMRVVDRLGGRRRSPAGGTARPPAGAQPA